MSIDTQISKIGASFRGLWKSVVLPDRVDRWSVTFIYEDEYVETPYMLTAEAALGYALAKLRRDKP